MKKFGSVAFRTTALVAVVSLAAACGAGGRDEATESSEGSTVGITDTSVKIGAHFPLTGVAAPGYSEIPTGAQAYFDYVNAAGGVNGRQIEYVVRDEYSESRAKYTPLPYMVAFLPQKERLKPCAGR